MSSIGMTSLKDIAAEAVAHHDLLESRKQEDHGTALSDHQTIGNMRRMCLSLLLHKHLL